MNSEFVLWHNPRCSKSREALRILQEQNIQPIIREYLKDPPSREEIIKVLDLLYVMRDTNGEALGRNDKQFILQIVREKEKCWKENNISLSSLSGDEIIDLLVQFPKGIERPICIKDKRKAVIGRPPENIIDLISA